MRGRLPQPFDRADIAATQHWPRRTSPSSTRAHRVALDLAGAVVVALVGLAGCEAHFTNEGADAVDAVAADAGLFNGAGVGASCDGDEACRPGLACQAGACAPSGKGAANDACIISDECGKDLQCGFFGFCVPTAGKAESEPCTTVSDCARGLYCDIKGISGFCAKPAKDAGDLYASCTSTAQCMPGLMCSKTQGSCQPGSLPLSTDLFPGVACDVVGEAEMPFGARVVVPREGSTHDFYSTPYPNDLRRKGDKVDLSAHPRPGPGLLGLDLVGAMIDALNDELGGFSIAPTLYVRFTRALDEKSIVPSGPKQNVFFVDLDSKKVLPVDYAFKTARNKYICSNYLALHPNWGTALSGGKTYGLILTDELRADLGPDAEPVDRIPVQLDDVAALVGGSKPSDAALADAWGRYAKLRDWLKSKKINAAKVIAATSFTTADPARVMKKFRAAVYADKSPPELVGTPFVCGGANQSKPSPCIDPSWAVTHPGQSDPRDCPANADSLPWTEVHVKIKLPVWQQGARPYLEGGGGVVVNNNNSPKIQGHEDVCASLIFPKGVKMPSGGWPLLLYGHGTGGSLRSGPQQMGASLAPLKDGGKTMPIAMLSLDQPMHGDRRGVPLDPGPLFYNFANPPAAKGNVYQGAADNFALVRFAETFKGVKIGSLGTVKFDASKLMYMGHSQGGTTGPIFLPWAFASGKADTLGAVFSGTGGSLVFSLLNKKSPEDATVGIKIALQEGDLDEWHPALALMQHYFDEVDPMVYAPLYYHTPVGPPVHVLHTYGRGDTYTPPETSRVFAANTKGLLLKPGDAGEWFDNISDLAMTLKSHTEAISGNIKAGDKAITGVTVEHLNDAGQSVDGKAYDGHFVAFKDKLCHKQVTTFLATLLNGKTPVVPEK
jgi:hypothetical protein